MRITKNAAFSPEAHYRKKYKGWDRLRYTSKYVGFWVLDFFWGNGERPWRLARSAFFVWVLGIAYGAGVVGLPFSEAIRASAKAFVLGRDAGLGVAADISLTLARYLILGMFVASLVKRLARR